MNKHEFDIANTPPVVAPPPLVSKRMASKRQIKPLFGILAVVGACFLLMIFNGIVSSLSTANKPVNYSTKESSQTLVQSELDKIANQVAQATLLKVRVEPFRDANKKWQKMVYIDWENTGTAPIKVVDADINVYDKKSNRIDSCSVKGKCIFSYEDFRPINPGERYIEPKGMGFILYSLPGEKIGKVKANITRAYKSDEEYAAVFEEKRRNAREKEEQRLSNLPELELLSYKGIRKGYFSYIVGTVRNNTKYTYKYVEIVFELINKNGSLVGNAQTNVAGLSPGQIWEFKAFISYDNVHTAKLKSLSGTKSIFNQL